MIGLLRTVHVLSVALWFGAVVFFTVAGVLIFQAYEKESLRGTEGNTMRAEWFPRSEIHRGKPPAGSNFPDPLEKEQGSRAAGVAVSGIFPFYFFLQTTCSTVAVLTAIWLFGKRPTTVNRVRLVVCVLGLAAVSAGWWLERKVHHLRDERSTLTDAVLLAPSPTAEQIDDARSARAEFGKWHGISLLANFASLALALVAASLAAHFPEPARGMP
jgi:hypothetical protein